MGSEEPLARLWREHSTAVMAYALRQVDRADADDIVSEVFTVAWRRRADIPAQELPWLLVVARNVVANHRRTARRQDQVKDVIARLTAATAPFVTVDGDARSAAVDALAAMTDVEREALLLVAWDGLTPPQAAQVAGCSVGAFHVRLLRARRRLDTHDAPDVEASSASRARTSGKATS